MRARMRSRPLKATFNPGKSLFQTRKNMDQRAILDHQFVVAAYTITWVVQLGYLAWLGMKWRTEKRNARLKTRNPR